jgi:hypothetical protein
VRVDGAHAETDEATPSVSVRFATKASNGIRAQLNHQFDDAFAQTPKVIGLLLPEVPISTPTHLASPTGGRLFFADDRIT